MENQSERCGQLVPQSYRDIWGEMNASTFLHSIAVHNRSFVIITGLKGLKTANNAVFNYQIASTLAQSTNRVAEVLFVIYLATSAIAIAPVQVLLQLRSAH